jgi:UDP-glucose 4,6-dehydratase
MDSRMIVILGGNGYVGQAFQNAMRRRDIPYCVVSRSSVDYFQRAALQGLLTVIRPCFLINAAGFTGRPNVDACESARGECLAGNAMLPATIREVCESLEIPWGHVSSGCIYTGTHSDGTGFRESDPPNFSFRQNNCSFYSGTKAMGEELLEGARDCYIWRLRIPFNEQDCSRNYISKLMRYSRLLNARNSLSQLDECINSCLQSWVNRIPFGIYNLTNPGSVTTADVVSMIRKHRLCDREFSFFESETEFMTKAAVAPRSNCVLDTTKATLAGIGMRPVEEAIEMALKNWNGASVSPCKAA